MCLSFLEGFSTPTTQFKPAVRDSGLANAADATAGCDADGVVTVAGDNDDDGDAVDGDIGGFIRSAALLVWIFSLTSNESRLACADVDVWSL